MNDMYFTFQSLTAAQRGQSACRRYGVAAELTRAPRSFAVRGCGYALRVPSDGAGQVSLILRLEQIPFERAYRLQNGGAEEVAL